MNNIKAFRLQKEMTLKELGRRCDISESSMQRIESGTRKPSFEVLLKLTEALDCSSEDLFGEKVVKEIAKLPPPESDLQGIKKAPEAAVINGFRCFLLVRVTGFEPAAS